MHSQLLVLLGGVATVLGQTQYTSTVSSAIAKARATALTESPTSNVVGKSFNRFVTIWCENTDYSMAAADSELILSLTLILNSLYFQEETKRDIRARNNKLTNCQQTLHTSHPKVFSSPTTSPSRIPPSQTTSPQ